MEKEVKQIVNNFLELAKKKEVCIISHFDTDGITSASIMIKTLKKLDIQFTVKIINNLEEKIINELPKNKIILFLDLASNSLDCISKSNQQNVFIIDHHEIKQNQVFPENLHILNPHLHDNGEEMSNACLTYLICKEMDKKDNSMANLAVIGTVGDLMETKLGPLANSILKDSDLTIKKGFLLYPSTRPLNKALEYCSNPYIPGVTGNSLGTLDLLREANIQFTKQGYKSLMELDEDEMQRLVTAIALRMPNPDKMINFIGNLFLVKFFNKLEDARELSALINACSRMGESNICLLFCMGNETARKHAESIYIRYKQSLIEALNHVSTNPKIEGNQYVILNAKDKIQDTIIGTVASIMSMSTLYKEGTVIITMAYNQDKIKISSRICGRGRQEEDPRNLRDFMNEITELIGGESGGHKFAAGCVIDKEKEHAFIELVKKKLDIEVVKV